MGWFGKNDYEKHEEKLAETLGTILEDELEVSELRKLCNDLIGSYPKNGQILRNEEGKEILEFEDPISRRDFCDFYFHYDELEEVNDLMLAKYLIKHKFLEEDNEDYGFITTHDEDGKDEDEDEDSEEEEDSESKSKDSDYMMDSIILQLERKFEPEKVYDEKELQNLLRSFLQHEFPKATVEREVILKNKDSIDVLVDGKYAIEAKIPNSRTELRNLSAQLEEYQEEYPNIIALILNNEEKELTEDIQHYVDRFKSKLGIESVVKHGKKRG
jgi:hypothetical protein